MIYVTGDTHGEERRFDECVPRYLNIGAGDTIIVAGDFGMIWNYDPNYTDDYNFPISDNERLDMIASKPFRTLFVDGNHENHPKIATYPLVEFCGGKAHEIRKDKIYHLCRGEIYTIENKTIFTMGGAYSVDKYMRQEGVSWWAEELPNEAEYKNAIANLERVNHKVDYIITHTAPAEIIKMMGYYGDIHDAELTGFFDWILLNTDYRRWYFGHWHTDDRYDLKHYGKDKRFRPIYFDMCQIDTFD